MKKYFIIIKLAAAVVCAIIYLACLYAGISGNIDFLQVITERRGPKSIFGYSWMVCGILASGGFYLSIESVWDYYKILVAWRKKYSILVFLLEAGIPVIIMILLDFKRRYGDEAGIIIAVCLIFCFFMFLIAQWSNIRKFIKNKLSEAKKGENEED